MVRPYMRDVVDVNLGLPSTVAQLEVKDPTALVQALGWLKYTSGNSHVLFRGQAALHGGKVTPSGLRTSTGGVFALKGMQGHDEAMTAYLDEIWGGPCTCAGVSHAFADGHLCKEKMRRPKETLMRGLWRGVTEPLLQHYGLRTRWIDLVDNVWVALWFACHEYVSADKGQFAYLRPRSIATRSYAYLLVLDFGKLKPVEKIPGYWLGTESRLVDLRYAAPSSYVRPHAQHGLLAAPRGPLTPAGMTTLTKRVRAVVRVDLSLAREWLGSGRMVSNYVLFPPAVRDEGYRRLLRETPAPDARLGAFTHIGPGH